MIIGSAKGGVTLPNENNSTFGLTTPAPVSFDTCTGYNTQYDPESTGDVNIRATKITATASGDVAYLSCELEDAVGNVIMALYADDSGVPDALMGKTLSTACGAGVNKIELISSVSIVNGVVYWIAFQNDAANAVKLSFTAPAGTSYYADNTGGYGVINDPFPSGALLARGYQLCMSSS